MAIPRRGMRIFQLLLEDDIRAKMAVLAKIHRRSLTMEIQCAVDAWVARYEELLPDDPEAEAERKLEEVLI